MERQSMLLPVPAFRVGDRVWNQEGNYYARVSSVDYNQFSRRWACTLIPETPPVASEDKLQMASDQRD